MVPRRGHIKSSLKILMEDHFSGLWAFNPEIVRRIKPGKNFFNTRWCQTRNPVHDDKTLLIKPRSLRSYLLQVFPAQQKREKHLRFLPLHLFIHPKVKEFKYLSCLHDFPEYAFWLTNSDHNVVNPLFYPIFSQV